MPVSAPGRTGGCKLQLTFRYFPLVCVQSLSPRSSSMYICRPCVPLPDVLGRAGITAGCACVVAQSAGEFWTLSVPSQGQHWYLTRSSCLSLDSQRARQPGSQTLSFSQNDDILSCLGSWANRWRPRHGVLGTHIRNPDRAGVLGGEGDHAIFRVLGRWDDRGTRTFFANLERKGNEGKDGNSHLSDTFTPCRGGRGSGDRHSVTHSPLIETRREETKKLHKENVRSRTISRPGEETRRSEGASEMINQQGCRWQRPCETRRLRSGRWQGRRGDEEMRRREERRRRKRRKRTNGMLQMHKCKGDAQTVGQADRRLRICHLTLDWVASLLVLLRSLRQTKQAGSILLLDAGSSL